MQLNLDLPTTTFHLREYSEEGIQINDTLYRRSLIIMPQAIVADWTITSSTQLTEQDIAAWCAQPVDVIIMGTGIQSQILPASLYTTAYKHQKSLEVMSTPAACRTYSLLATEGRRVLAALIFP